MIETLTAEQEALLPVVRDEWLRIGLCCEPADRARAEAGVRAAYAEVGLAPPPIVVWLDSPLAGCIGSALLSNRVGDQVAGQVWDQVRGQVRGQVADQVAGQVEDQVAGQVSNRVWDQVSNRVWDQVSNQVSGQVGDQVADQVGDQVAGQVWDQVWDQVWSAVYGQHDAGWLSFFDYFQRACPDVKGPERHHGLCEVARSAGWWWPYADAVVLTERPTALHRDPLNRLHCETGPAIVYPDGGGVHCWHGTRVPADLIELGWDHRQILAEPNTEIRRAAIERLGWDRFIADAGLKLVDEQPDPANAPHTLALYDIPERLFGTPVRVLLMTNASPERDGTRRRYGETVPADISDAVHAAAWQCSIDAETYRELERAT